MYHCYMCNQDFQYERQVAVIVGWKAKEKTYRCRDCLRKAKDY